MYNGWLFKTSVGFSESSHNFDQLTKEEQTTKVVYFSKIFEGQVSNLMVRLKSFTHSLDQDVIDQIEEEFERIKDNFGFIVRLKEDYKEEDWKVFDFNGDFVKEFDDVLEDFYDVGYSNVHMKNGQIKKLCWIK